MGDLSAPVFLAVILYFVPLMVAGSRNHPQWPAIGTLNLLLGWTGLGWIAAMVWAMTSVNPPRR